MVELLSKILKETCGKQTIVCVNRIKRVPDELHVALRHSNLFVVSAEPHDVFRAAGLETENLYFIDVQIEDEAVAYLRTRLRTINKNATLAMHFFYTSGRELGR